MFEFLCIIAVLLVGAVAWAIFLINLPTDEADPAGPVKESTDKVDE